MGLKYRDTDLRQYDSGPDCHCGAGRNLIFMGLIDRDTDLRQYDQGIKTFFGMTRSQSVIVAQAAILFLWG